MEKTIIIPKNIPTIQHYFNYRCLTPTAIMNVLRENFPSRYFQGGYSTYAYIDRDTTMPDRFAKHGRDSCNVLVRYISMRSDKCSHEIITNKELSMLFRCGELYIRVNTGESSLSKSGWYIVEIRNNKQETNQYSYYPSCLSHTTPPTAKQLKEQKEETGFVVVLNHDHP